MVHVLPWKCSEEKEESPCSPRGCVKHQDCQKENVLRWSLSAQCSATTRLEPWLLIGYRSSANLTFSLTGRKGCAKSRSSPCMSDSCVVLPGLFCRLSPLAISSVLGATFPCLRQSLKQFKFMPVTQALICCLYSPIRPPFWAQFNPVYTRTTNCCFEDSGSIGRFSVTGSHTEIGAKTHRTDCLYSWKHGVTKSEDLVRAYRALGVGRCEIFYESKWNKYVFIYCAKTLIYCFARLFLPTSSFKDAMISGSDRISYTLPHGA